MVYPQPTPMSNTTVGHTMTSMGIIARRPFHETENLGILWADQVCEAPRPAWMIRNPCCHSQGPPQKWAHSQLHCAASLTWHPLMPALSSNFCSNALNNHLAKHPAEPEASAATSVSSDQEDLQTRKSRANNCEADVLNPS